MNESGAVMFVCRRQLGLTSAALLQPAATDAAGRQMAYKAHATPLIRCVASIKNGIETDTIRLCLRDLRKCKSLI